MSNKKSFLTRRDFLAGAVVIGSSRFRSATPACTLSPEQEEGPYYVDYLKLRRDLTEGKPGVLLQLRIMLLDAKTCRPIENAAVDIWHCDALGVYSGFTANSGGEDGPRGFGPPPGGPPQEPAGGPFAGRGFGGPGGQRGPRRPGGPGGGRGAQDETRFLRGVQLTDAHGAAEFVTLYPGWYAGRTIHIHLKSHIGGQAGASQYSGGHVSHTGQIFFPEDITEEIAKMEPYLKHTVHRTLHSEDHVFSRQGGSQSIASLERLQKGTNAGGFLATITAAVNPDTTPQPF
jgi:protocatechuate 3,4-dioxygenase beta subunit